MPLQAERVKTSRDDHDQRLELVCWATTESIWLLIAFTTPSGGSTTIPPSTYDSGSTLITLALEKSRKKLNPHLARASLVDSHPSGRESP